MFGCSAAVASLGGENSCEVPGTGLLGGSGAVDVPSGILKDTGLLLEHTDSLLLLRCLLFILKIRPSSFLTSSMILLDLTSTCFSIRALYHWPDLSVGLALIL